MYVNNVPPANHGGPSYETEICEERRQQPRGAGPCHQPCPCDPDVHVGGHHGEAAPTLLHMCVCVTHG